MNPSIKNGVRVVHRPSGLHGVVTRVIWYIARVEWDGIEGQKTRKGIVLVSDLEVES